MSGRGEPAGDADGGSAAVPPTSALQPSPWLPRLAPLVLAGAVLAVYGSSLSAPWVWDDWLAIVGNPAVRTLWPPAEAFAAAPDAPVAGRPIAAFSLALDHALFGMDVAAFRATNAAIHALAAWALFGLTRRTLRSPKLATRYGAAADGIALASALLWAVHPLIGECVSYVTQRTTSLFGLFFLLTLYSVGRAAGPRGSARWAIAAIAACLAGMGSKQVMVTAPVVALVYDRLCWSDSFRGALRARGSLHAGLCATWLALGALIATGPEFARHSIGYGLGVGPLDYLAAQAPILVHYLRLAVWPVGQVLDYGHYAPVPVGAALAPGALLGAAFAATLWGVARGSAVAFLPFVYFAVLSPTSSVVPVGAEVGAERRMYIPLAAISVWICTAVAVRLPAARARWRVAAVAAVALALMATARSRAELFLDPVALWTSAAAATPDNPRPHLILGGLLVRGGQPEAGMAHYRQALALDPEYTDAWNNLATVHHRAGRYDEAIDHYREALRLAPQIGYIHHNLARAYRASGRGAEALAEYRRMLELQPVIVGAVRELAWLLATDPDPGVRDPDEAVRLAGRAAQLAGGGDPEILDTLAVAYASAGEWAEAVAAARQAAAADPTPERGQRLAAARERRMRGADIGAVPRP